MAPPAPLCALGCSASAPSLGALKAKDAAARSFFDEETPQDRDVRQLFEWMAGGTGARQLSRCQFKERLPEIHRRCPQVVSSFMRLDSHGEAVVRLEDFKAFCGSDARLARAVRKASNLVVYGTDRTGRRVDKDPVDSVRISELGSHAPLLPWEVKHTVEWTVEDLKIFLDRPSTIASYGGAEVPAGAYITSPAFEAAGVRGHLRFWPAGYWTLAQRQTRERLARDDAREALAPPAFNSWCGISACFPQGSNLIYRLFIGDATSSRRECFWTRTAHAATLWGPAESKPPLHLLADRNPLGGGSIKVGLEIYSNLSVQKSAGGMARLMPEGHCLRNAKRPLLTVWPSGLPSAHGGGTAPAPPPEPGHGLRQSLRAAALQAVGAAAPQPLDAAKQVANQPADSHVAGARPRLDSSLDCYISEGNEQSVAL